MKAKTEICQIDSLKESLSTLQATLESTADGILVVNDQGTITSYNQKFRKMWRIPNKVMADKGDSKAIGYVLKQVADPEAFVEKLKFLYNAPQANCFDEINFKDGRIFERYSIPQKMGRKIIGRVFSFRDITDRKHMEQQLVYQATHDSLTGLPNRNLLLDRINESIKIAKRRHSKVAIALFDLNRFKGVNDSLGHEAGDILLNSVSQRLSAIIRETDTLARLGGDEFVLVLPEIQEKEDVFPIIQRCMAVFDIPFKVNEHTITSSISMGISLFPEHGDNAQVLLKHSDSAMYSAKAEGQKSFHFYGSYMTDKAVEKLAAENDLHRAIQQKQFSIFYQPIFDLKTGRSQSAEALIRWNHPTKGIISPDNFIPLAEETGDIIPMGSWILQEVGRQLKEWHDDGIPPIHVAVNVSALQLKNTNFLNEIDAVITNNKLDPSWIEIEITETGLISNLNYFLETLQSIRNKGLSLAVDDFGMGYSNFSYLNILPINKLKIDKSFIQDQSEKGKNIVLTVLALAKKLNLKVVGEGIETRSQLEFLFKNQCDEAQGYYFSKP